MPIVNVYKEKELKNAYIGEVYEYSYDFRNKSVATLMNEGYLFSTISYAGVDANGLYCSQWTTINKALTIPNSANKIIMHSTGKVTASDHDSFFGAASSTNTGLYDFANGVYGVINGVDNTNSLSVGAGTYNKSMELDLVNKTAVFKFGNNTYTYTLTDVDISVIRQSTQMRIVLAKNVYIQDISITIE